MSKAVLKNEPRRYMGPKWARVPRGAIVWLIGTYRRMGFFEWNGERFCCPVRILHRLKDTDPYKCRLR